MYAEKQQGSRLEILHEKYKGTRQENTKNWLGTRKESMAEKQ